MKHVSLFCEICVYFIALVCKWNIQNALPRNSSTMRTEGSLFPPASSHEDQFVFSMIIFFRISSFSSFMFLVMTAISVFFKKVAPVSHAPPYTWLYTNLVFRGYWVINGFRKGIRFKFKYPFLFFCKSASSGVYSYKESYANKLHKDKIL